ncbi:MAG: endonuclease III [Candidatus Omnitrophota bacterium]
MDGIRETIKSVKKQVALYILPSVTVISRQNDPYRVLVSCMLSLRTKDEVTMLAADKLFKAAGSINNMVRLSCGRIEKLIYPVGFYRTKARAILKTNKKILDYYGGKVPCNIEKLLSLSGVGRKTANLVMGLACNIPAICVDTHVHRMSNRLGWVNSKRPDETEEQLKKVVPKKYWISLNTIFVSFGRNICKPVSPHCSACSVSKHCRKIGVKRSR